MNKNLYKNSLTSAMTELCKIDNTVFIGQQLLWHGNPMSNTVKDIPTKKLIEVPVMEESQMGMSLGLAMSKKFVITFYPRWDFLICATNQLVNHIDKIKLMSNGNWNPHMIIRIGKGSDTPLDPGHQHKGNYLEEFKSMCPNIQFYDLKSHIDIELAYKTAINNIGIYCLVEYPELY
jgi:pyruvate/2-oxoglutarate/acetoin dehydrogenase E1 component